MIGTIIAVILIIVAFILLAREIGKLQEKIRAMDNRVSYLDNRIGQIDSQTSMLRGMVKNINYWPGRTGNVINLSTEDIANAYSFPRIVRTPYKQGQYWRCDYCGRLNGNQENCTGCGAPAPWLDVWSGNENNADQTPIKASDLGLSYRPNPYYAWSNR